MGTVSYLPPELVTDGIADARSDVYALGVLLFELLTGTKPHAGDSPIQIAYQHVHHDVPAPSTIEPGIPPYLDAFVARATARDRGQRPADAQVLMRQLHRVRHALDNDVANDEELTADLTPSLSVLPASRVTAGLTASTSDPTDEVFDFAAYDDFDPDPIHNPGPDFVRTGRPEHTLVVSDTSLDAGPGSGPADLPVPAAEPASTAAASGSAHDPATIRARRRGGGWVALLVVLLLAAGAATAGWYYGVGRFHSTPNVIGLAESRARETMERAGLSVRVGASAYSETIPARHVVSTDPPPGADVLEDATVTVVLSKGPERHEMPDLAGLSRSAAVAAIKANALRVGELKEAWHESVEKGTVISFHPKAGTVLMRGDAVRLLVSKGPKPIQIKDFTGTPAAGAVQQLKASGLVVHRVEHYSDHTAKGLVLRQEPASGVRYAGDPIRLVVSLGQHLVPVPDVSSYGLDAATTTLEEAGFTVTVAHYEAYFGLGFVVSQTPGAGDLAPYGSEIVVKVV